MLRLVCGAHGARGRALADACLLVRRGGHLLVSTANEMLPPDLSHQSMATKGKAGGAQPGRRFAFEAAAQLVDVG
jgi:hypothetical protein